MSQHTSQNGFAQFDLNPTLLKGIEKAGYQEPRPIQAATLPTALAGSDILGLAQTGTGKTAGFAIPIVERILKNPNQGPVALILAPTRELAAQIADELQVLTAFTKVKSVTIYGGVGQGPQVAKIKKNPDIIIACPGRLLDLLGQGLVKLGGVKTLVLDEADHMFDMGFLVPIRKILKHLPTKRQNLFFSATMPKEIRTLADEMLHKPTVVELPSTKPVDLIEQVVYPVHDKQKLPLLEHLLNNDGVSRAIIFTRTKHRAKSLARKLERSEFNAVSLQGNMSQNARDRAISGFKSGEVDILVATDIAARGIDVSKVSHVINYDVPDTPEAYTHRIGRTGRAQCTGKACTFLTTDGRATFRAIERKIGQNIEQEVLDQFMTYDGPETPPQAAQQNRSNRGTGQGQRRNPQGQRPQKKRTGGQGAAQQSKSNGQHAQGNKAKSGNGTSQQPTNPNRRRRRRRKPSGGARPQSPQA